MTRLPGRWRLVRVDELITSDALAINDGYRVTRKELGRSGVPFVRGGDIGDGDINVAVQDHVLLEFQDRVKTKLSQDADVAFIAKGTVGRVGYLRPGQSRVVFAPQVCYWRVLDRTVLDPRFIFYLLRSHAFQANLDAVKTHGSMVADYVSLSDQRRFRLHLPPVGEQRAIAQILGALDDKIEADRRMNETLEAMARALFKSWFVDFDPVRAKVDGERSFPGMSQCIFDGLPFRFAASPIGYVPAGWRVVCVGDMADINAWTLNDSDDLQRVEYVEISGVERGEVGTVSVYERGSEPSRARRRVRHGDTVISTVRPERGTYFLCLNPSPSLIVSTGFAVISPRSAPWSFVHAAMTREEVFERLGQLADGAAYPAVRPQVIAATELVLPTEAEMLTEFHSSSSPLFERTDVNRRESRRLVAIRDALLPKLLSGEIRVKDAERLVERAV